MSEKIIFYNVQKDLMFHDYFELDLVSGEKLLWKNFGQVITINGKDFRKQKVEVGGAIMRQSEFSFVENVAELFNWIIDAYEVGYGTEENYISITTPTDKIVIELNTEYDTRSEQFPERDYFYWINEYPLYQEFKTRMGLEENKVLKYLENWRRPKLRTNGKIKMVVYHNEIPTYVGMLDGEKKKSYIDAFFRLIYYFQFFKENNVR
ncbi:MAG TPA: hypothetical protein ENG48_11165 [Candidatus Atribacteria bacterium]|nr:hypothetical protein [Candidatus Atribacteria bacterium]